MRCRALFIKFWALFSSDIGHFSSNIRLSFRQMWGSQTHRHTGQQTPAPGQADTQTHRYTDTEYTDTDTRTHTETQTHRHTDTQTHRHTDSQKTTTHIHTYTHPFPLSLSLSHTHIRLFSSNMGLPQSPEDGHIYCILLIRIAFCHMSENLPLRCLFYDTMKIFFCFLC